jgi:Zn-dependent metalloprotease
MIMIKKFTILFYLLVLSFGLFSQVKDEEIVLKDQKGKPSLIKFKDTKVNSDEFAVKSFLKTQFELSVNDNYKSEETIIEQEFKSEKFQQYYRGMKVEYGILKVVSRNNKLKTINGRHVEIKEINTIPKLTEEEALKIALDHVGAERYMWQDESNEQLLKSDLNDQNATYYPIGELVIIEKDLFGKNSIPVLAYKFDIYASYPVSRNYIYVNANDGEVVFQNPIIKNVQGTANTRYSGQRDIETQLSSSQYRLRDYSRGNGVETFNMNNGTSYSNVSDFVDNNNDWTAAEYHNTDKDDAALDAHWGAEMTYDYFWVKHRRNSYNGSGAALKNYVHANLVAMGYSSNDNAFWDGQRMTYGDGSWLCDALTSIDVVAHEIGHGVCSQTANLAYQKESGAINEGLSDIWGAMVEYYAAPEKQTYLIGEDIMLTGNAIRSMSNPNMYSQPDTYGGTNWVNQDGCTATRYNDYCGVHTNGGVLNHWFFILAEGHSGTNDIGNSFNISGVGKDRAAKIVYRAESMYFTSTTDFNQARELTIQAADDLYGDNSDVVYHVAYAWYAVGVGSQPSPVSHYIQGPTQLTPGYSAMYYINPYLNATNYVWTIPSGCSYNYCWDITRGQGTSSIRIKAGKIGQHEITCKIYNGSQYVTSQYITVNVQNPYGGGGSGGGSSDPCDGTDPDDILKIINGVIYPPEPCDENTIMYESNSFVHIAVYNLMGQKLKESYKEQQFDIKDLSLGIYLIRAELNNGNVITEKIFNE